MEKLQIPTGSSIILTDENPVCRQSESRFVEALEDYEVAHYGDAEVIVLVMDVGSQVRRVVVSVDMVLVKRDPHGEHNGIIFDDSLLNGFLVNDVMADRNNPVFLLGRPLCGARGVENSNKNGLEKKLGRGIVPEINSANFHFNPSNWRVERLSIKSRQYAKS